MQSGLVMFYKNDFTFLFIEYPIELGDRRIIKFENLYNNFYDNFKELLSKFGINIQHKLDKQYKLVD